jgi:hypothetical protein
MLIKTINRLDHEVAHAHWGDLECDRMEPDAGLAQLEARNQLLEQLAAEIMGHYTGLGLGFGFGGVVIAQIDRTVLQRWRKTLDNAKSS